MKSRIQKAKTINQQPQQTNQKNDILSKNKSKSYFKKTPTPTPKYIDLSISNLVH